MTAVQHLPSFDGRSNFHRNGPGYNGFGGGNARGGGGGGGGQGGYGQHHIVGPADRQQQFFGYAAPLAPLLSNRTHYDSSSSLNYQQPLPAFYPTYSANHSIAPPRSLHPSPQISNNGQHFVSDYAPLPRYSSQLPPLSSHHQQSALSRQNHDSADYNRRPYSNTRSSSREFDGPRGSEMRRDQSRGRGDDRLYEAGGEVRFSSVGANQGGGNHRYRPEVEQNRMSRSLSRFNPGSVASRESYETLGRFQAHPSFVVPYGRSVALVDHDHPSFDRPPCAAPHSSALPNGSQYSTSPNEPVEYQLVSNMNPVPPPPPIEKSAVPLADLATELIWDACRYAATSPSSDRSISSLDRWSGRRSSMVDELPALRFSHLIKPHSQSAPQTPELFGAVGEGRRRRQRQASSSSSSSDGASDVSSPSSSSPGTPGGSLLFEAVVAKKSIRLGGLGLDFEYEEMKADEMDAQVRKLSHLPPPPPTALPPTLAPEPSPAFRQFVKQVLTATLLAPEDLVLAVRYIASLPLSSMIPPTTSSRKGDAQASAVKAAPFKLVLGGLMLANKTLQDNSYRNETFASVSGIPLVDVNALEVFLFNALHYDVVVDGDDWESWVSIMKEQWVRGIALGKDMGNQEEVAIAIARLERAAVRRAKGPTSASFSTPRKSSTTDLHHHMRSVTSRATLISNVNLDESGPLRSPQRFESSSPPSFPVRTRYAAEATPTRRMYTVA